MASRHRPSVRQQPLPLARLVPLVNRHKLPSAQPPPLAEMHQAACLAPLHHSSNPALVHLDSRRIPLVGPLSSALPQPNRLQLLVPLVHLVVLSLARSPLLASVRKVGLVHPRNLRSDPVHLELEVAGIHYLVLPVLLLVLGSARQPLRLGKVRVLGAPGRPVVSVPRLRLVRNRGVACLEIQVVTQPCSETKILDSVRATISLAERVASPGR